MSRDKLSNNKINELPSFRHRQNKSEFRQDIVSRDWILVAGGREDYVKKVLEKREKEKIKKTVAQIKKEIKTCPFENPQKSGHPKPILSYPNLSNIQPSTFNLQNDWFLQILPNKYPAVETHFSICPIEENIGPYSRIGGVGFHEIVITRDHFRPIALLEENEIGILLNAYKERYISLSKEKCLKYIFIFHNSGKEAGASIEHPHSQIMALPIIPPDVKRSLQGCVNYFKKRKKCAHCAAIEWEIKQKERIIEQNSDFIAFCPYASRTNFEIRIFPLKHASHFEKITQAEIANLADIFKKVFKKIYDKLNNPSYNFFIHTASLFDNSSECYHWHIEILPRISIWAGFELGTGIEVIVISPEKAAKTLCG